MQEGEITAGHGVPRRVVHELSRRESGIPPSREIPRDIEVIRLDDKGAIQKAETFDDYTATENKTPEFESRWHEGEPPPPVPESDTYFFKGK